MSSNKTIVPARVRKTGIVATAMLKKYSQVLYAIILIVLIPLVIIANTYFVIGKFKNLQDLQLQRQAMVIAELFDTTAFDSLNDLSRAKEAIKALSAGPEELRSFDILVPEGDQFRVVASSFSENVDTVVSAPNIAIAWTTNRGIAHQSTPSVDDIRHDPELTGERYWNVIFPLHTADGQKIAMLNLKMSLKVSTDLFSEVLKQSLLLLFGTLIIVLVLLFVNTRLFQFAILFKKLEEVDKMKDEFISMASHELRTPITAIRGYLSMFIDGSFGVMSEGAKKGIDIMNASINRLKDLVEDLLDVSRIEQQRIQMNLESVDLVKSITQTIDEISINAKEKKLEVRFEQTGAIPAVYADQDKMKQVLVNLIGNAIKYTKKGSVVVSAKVDEKQVLVKIKDTGIGMGAKDRERLFTKFYRVSNEETKGIVGTGLGLWITKQLIELMGGEITVDSMENVGTEMTFSVPILTGQVIQKKS